MDELIQLYKDQLQELFQTHGFPSELTFENWDGEYIHYRTEDDAWSQVNVDDLELEHDYKEK